jgi:hypothetical protein
MPSAGRPLDRRRHRVVQAAHDDDTVAAMLAHAQELLQA